VPTLVKQLPPPLRRLVGNSPTPIGSGPALTSRRSVVTRHPPARDQAELWRRAPYQCWTATGASGWVAREPLTRRSGLGSNRFTWIFEPASNDPAPMAWEAFLDGPGNPRIPTLAEAMDQALSPADIERLSERFGGTSNRESAGGGPRWAESQCTDQRGS